MTLKINISDSKSVNDAIKQIEKYTKSLQKKCETFLMRVGRLGIEIASARIDYYDIPLHIKQSLTLEAGDMVVEGNSIKVIVNETEALYWEYGTGIMGKNNPHPEPDTWIYDIHGHGDKGWVYTSAQGELTQWSYELKDKVYRTYGMMAQPFMYDTFSELSHSKWREICEIAREVFSE